MPERFSSAACLPVNLNRSVRRAKSGFLPGVSYGSAASGKD